MDNKKIYKILNQNLVIIDEILESLIKIEFSENEDFYYFIRRINILDNDIFFTKNVEDIYYMSILKKIFIQINRKKYLFYEYKYKLISIFSKIKKLYKKYIEMNINIENDYLLSIEMKRNKINEENQYFVDQLNEMNSGSEFYYIKLLLNKEIPLFHITRNNFLYYLKQHGKPYNYTPSNLDNTVYDYFILDYKVSSDINVESILNDFIDSSIISYKIMKVDTNKSSIYNLKFYYKTYKYLTPDEIFNNFNILDSHCYESLIDCYINDENHLGIIDKIFNVDFGDLDLIIMKRFDEREGRVFVLNDITILNVDYFKYRIMEILEDKKISDIIYKGKVDFSGLQLLEKFKEKYDVEYAGYNI